MSLVQLPPATVKLIGSSQVITSVSSVVKELMENAIDSGAQQIEVKLEKHGLEKIEVKDDGCGIKKCDVPVMCLKNYTSKISDFSDLDSLSSYGFRGEALSSLCNVANVYVTTKTDQDDVATCYTFDQNGQVTCSKTSHIVKGTIVTITELFKKLPVRKQFMSNAKRATEELKKIERLVKCLAVVHPRLRVTLIHNKFLCWQKISVTNLRQSVMQVVSISMAKQLHHILHNTDQIRVEMLVPKSDCNIEPLCFSNFSDAHFLFINQRPVRDKDLEKVIYNKLFEYFGVYVPVNKFPLCVTCIRVPPGGLDVNLEPNKTRVYLKDKENVIDFLKQCMHLYYHSSQKEVDEHDELKPVKKRKIETESPEKESKKEETTNDQSEKSETRKDAVLDKSSSNDDLDSTFVNYCLERDKTKNNISVINSVNEKTTSGEQDIKFSNEVSLTSSNYLSSGLIQKKVTSAKPLFNNDSTCNESKQEINKFGNTKEYLEHLPDLEDSEKSDNYLGVGELRNAAETLCQVTNNPHHSNDYSIHLPTEETFIDCNNIVASEDDEMPVVYEESPCITTDSGRGSQEDSSPTLSQWSRGDVKISSHSLKGPSVLTTALRAESPEISDKGVTTESPQASERSVASQMGCKEMSAFTKFARNMRKKILQENPHMSFTRVAQQLQEKWRELNGDEKKKYEECTLLKKAASPSQKQRTLTEMLTSSTPKIELDINLVSLEQMVKCRTKRVKEESTCLIGRLESSPLWVYRGHDSSIKVISVQRLMEAVKFHDHLDNFALSSKLLESCVPISARIIGEPQWNLLLGLERSSNGVVKDPRILNNGFVVEIGESEAHLTYVPQHISHCGLGELREVLQLLQDHGSEATLKQCRPLKIISFLRSEVMRECCLGELPTERKEVSFLLSYWLKHVIYKNQCCIHHLPVTQPLNTL